MTELEQGALGRAGPGRGWESPAALESYMVGSYMGIPLEVAIGGTTGMDIVTRQK
jgi:hypothetical protein